MSVLISTELNDKTYNDITIDHIYTIDENSKNYRTEETLVREEYLDENISVWPITFTVFTYLTSIAVGFAFHWLMGVGAFVAIRLLLYIPMKKIRNYRYRHGKTLPDDVQEEIKLSSIQNSLSKEGISKLGSAFKETIIEITNTRKKESLGDAYVKLNENHLSLYLVDNDKGIIRKRDVAMDELVRFQLITDTTRYHDISGELEEAFHNLDRQKEIAKAMSRGSGGPINAWGDDVQRIKLHNQQVEINRKLKKEEDNKNNLQQILLIQLKDGSSLYIDHIRQEIFEETKNFIESKI